MSAKWFPYSCLGKRLIHYSSVVCIVLKVAHFPARKIALNQAYQKVCIWMWSLIRVEWDGKISSQSQIRKNITTYKEYISSYSFAPSREDFKMHKNSFAIFLIVSAIYMLLSFWLFTFKWSRPRTEAEVTGQNLKKRMVQANCGCVLIAMYLYYRHNRYCEPGMYSIFSIFEYGVVLTNMGYHWTSYYDFYDKTLQVWNIYLWLTIFSLHTFWCFPVLGELLREVAAPD